MSYTERGITDIDGARCADSSLHEPDEVGGIMNAGRFRNIPGSCASAAEAISTLGLPQEMIERCPALLKDYKSKGAPQAATCIAELIMFAEATQ